jgi:hypothetical protein
MEMVGLEFSLKKTPRGFNLVELRAERRLHLGGT